VNATSGVPVDYYAVKLLEEEPAETFVCQVKANIPDNYQIGHSPNDENELVEYSLVHDVDQEDPSGDTLNKFYEIDRETGRIVTTGERIDYEQEDVKRVARSLKVKAETKDKYFTYFTHVTIDIIDKNDNPPKFGADSPRQLSVVENSTLNNKGIIGRVHATDADSGIYSEIKYRLMSNTTLFRIGKIIIF
jgi:hypothetical protein